METIKIFEETSDMVWFKICKDHRQVLRTDCPEKVHKDRVRSEEQTGWSGR
jgi:hypothetical protein